LGRVELFLALGLEADFLSLPFVPDVGLPSNLEHLSGLRVKDLVSL